jgi:fructosamine-3-kinase
MFAAEARGLDWLRQAGTLRLPLVLAATPDFLALEYLMPGPRQPNFDESLGRGLAALHRSPAPEWGLDHDNFIGPLPQANGACATWPEFYAERRLRPQVAKATAGGHAPGGWAERFEKLYRALPTLLPDEPPSRLHGDLWGGNIHCGPSGEPCLIDPAAYAGHREVDLAMMRLFGGFGPGVFDSYHNAYPLREGHDLRVPLYQLYPLLVHVNLFGGGYVSLVEQALERVLGGKT